MVKLVVFAHHTAEADLDEIYHQACREVARTPERLFAKLAIARSSASRVCGAVLVLVLIALSGTTMIRNRDYRSRSAIWKSVCEVYPASVRGLTMLAAAYRSEGDYGRALEVQQRLEAKTKIEDNPWALSSRALLLLEAGDAGDVAARTQRDDRTVVGNHVFAVIIELAIEPIENDPECLVTFALPVQLVVETGKCAERT